MGVLYIFIAFLVALTCDEEGFDAAAKGLLWPLFIVERAIKIINRMIRND